MDALEGKQVGAVPVLMSRDLKKGREREDAPAGRIGFDTTAARRVKGKTFHLIAGIWVDGALTPSSVPRRARWRRTSDEYFALLREHPDLLAWLAIGEKVIVVTGGIAIEVE